MKKFIAIEDLSPLYEMVQTAGIFLDSKYFPDCLPNRTASQILRIFNKEKDLPEFDLKAFVERHFAPPPTPESEYHSAGKSISDHLQQLWEVLTRRPDTDEISTLLPLPHSYIVPGGRFREIYYWDSYFTMLGLRASGRYDLIRAMIDNFAHLVERFGFIPNGNRSYYLGRSQPPFFCLMVELLAQGEIDKYNTYRTYHTYRTYLEKEYRFWMAGERKIKKQSHPYRRIVLLPDGAILNRYWDDRDTPRPEAFIEDRHLAEKSARPATEVYRHIRAAAESGWDFSSRWFADAGDMSSIQTTDLLPIDLNCLLFYYEKTLAKIYALAERESLAKQFKDRAERRRNAVLNYCWDEQAGFFFDFNFQKMARSPYPTLAAVFPLFFEMVTPEQATRVAVFLEKEFLQSGGLRTTLAHTGQQWDAPNGWAPLQWMAFCALKNYGHHALAAKIRDRWMLMCEKVFENTGKMMEKYNVENPDLKAGGGEYPNQDGFGWTNGVYLGFLNSRNEVRL